MKIVNNTAVQNLLLAGTTGLLINLAWPPSNFNFLLLVAWVPLLLACFRTEKLRSWLGLYCLGLTAFYIPNSITAILQDDKNVISLVFGLIILPLINSLPILITWFIRKKKGEKLALLMFPFLFVSQEVLLYFGDLAITWLHMAYGLSVNTFFHGVLPIFGPEGATFLIMSSNAYLVSLLLSSKKLKWKSLYPVLIVPFIFLSAYLFQKPPNGTEIRVAIFQPNKSTNDDLKNNLTAQVKSFRSALKGKDLSEVKLIIGPESYFFDMKKTPLVANELQDQPAIIELQKISDSLKIPILSGAVLIEMFRSVKPPSNTAKPFRKGVFFEIYNGSFFISPNQKPKWRSKQTMVPFSENIPFVGFLNSLESKGLWPTRYSTNYGKAPFEGSYKYEALSIAPGICFEAIFPNVMGKYVESGANLQVIMSTNWTPNRNWKARFKDYMSVPVKALGHPMIVSSTEGESFICDFNGHRNIGDSSLVVAELMLNNKDTFYSKYASKPWIWWLLTFFAMFVGANLKRLA